MKNQNEQNISNDSKAPIYSMEYRCRRLYRTTHVGHMVLIPMLFFALAFFAFIWNFLQGEYILGMVSLIISLLMIPIMLWWYPTCPAKVKVYKDRIEFTDTKWGRLKLCERIVYFSKVNKAKFFTHSFPLITAIDFETNDGRKYELDLVGADKREIDNLLSSLKKCGVKVEKS